MSGSFLKHTILLFLALRIGDFVNVAAGMWFVPKYVSPEDIGAVLPVTSFATFLSLFIVPAAYSFFAGKVEATTTIDASKMA